LKITSGQIVVINLSGRGDKDVNEVARLMGAGSSARSPNK
jgi:tryptophan synthase beta subunit